jgi:hypothetical protein
MGCLGTVLPILLVLAGLLAGADLGIRQLAASQLHDRIVAAVPEASGVKVKIHSFPFVGRLIIGKPVSEVWVHVDKFTGGRLDFTDGQLVLHQVKVDTGTLLGQRRVQVTHFGSGTIALSLGEAALTGAVGRAVTVSGGVVNVEVLPGRPVKADVLVVGNEVQLQAPFLPALKFPLPNPKLLPCTPKVTPGDRLIRFACSFTKIPDALGRGVA